MQLADSSSRALFGAQATHVYSYLVHGRNLMGWDLWKRLLVQGNDCISHDVPLLLHRLHGTFRPDFVLSFVTLRVQAELIVGLTTSAWLQSVALSLPISSRNIGEAYSHGGGRARGLDGLSSL